MNKTGQQSHSKNARFGTNNGLQLKGFVEEYDGEIKRFKGVSAGRLKPRMVAVESSPESFSAQKAKRLEQER